MITNLFIQLGVGIFSSLFEKVQINILTIQTILERFFEFLRIAAYLLPMGTVAFILTTIISLQVFRVIIALFRAIRSILI